MPACLAFAGCIGSDGDLEARQEAADQVIDEVLVPAGLGESDVVIYGPTKKLKKGDTVMPVLGLDGQPIDPFVVEKDAWFFWIDRDPFARFAHSTQFVYVEDGDIRVEDQQWYAVVNEEELLVPDTAEDDPRRIWGQPVPPDPVTAAQLDEEGELRVISPPRHYLNTDGLERYAFVVNAWPGSNNTKHDWDTMYDIFRERGYTMGGVTPFEPGVEGSTKTRQAILDRLKALAVAREKPYSQFVFFYAGHGSEGSLVMGADKNSPVLLSASELATAVQDIDALEMVFITDACYTGGLITQFQAYWEGILKQENRTLAFYSAATATQPSYSDVIATGGSFTNRLAPRITENFGPNTFLPFVTEGWIFQIGTIGGFFAQTPRWDYASQCSTRGVTAPIRFNAMLTNGVGSCGLPTQRVALLIMDWGPDGTMTIQQGETGTPTTGTMDPDGSFDTYWDGPGTQYLHYDAFMDDEICGGVGTYEIQDAVGCLTTYDLDFSKQPWPAPP